MYNLKFNKIELLNISLTVCITLSEKYLLTYSYPMIADMFISLSHLDKLLQIIVILNSCRELTKFYIYF